MHRTENLPALAILTATVVLQASPVRAADDRMTFGYRAGFNLNASFRNVGTAAAFNNPLGSQSYADGFVGNDTTQNAGRLTTHWAYQALSQQVRGDSLLLRSSNEGPIAQDQGNDFSHGFEFSYGRYLGAAGRGRWGIEAAFNSTAVDIRSATLAASSVLAVDAFPLRGSVLLDESYTGPTTAGPGLPLLSIDPTRLEVSVANHLDTSLYGLRLGPFWEVTLTDRLALNLGAGLALLWVDAEYSFGETVTVPAFGSHTRVGSNSHSDLKPGGYVSATLSYAVRPRLSLDAGVQFQAADSFKIRALDKEAKLDMGSSLFLTLGLRWLF